MSIMSAYEKLQKEGKLNKPIHLQQPTPDNPDGRAFGSNGNYNDGVKNIINEKIVNNTNIKSETTKIKKLEKRVTLLEDTLQLIMKEHMKLMRK